MERFERAFLGAPQQGHEPVAVGRGCPCYQCLFFDGKVVSDKSIAAWLGHFHITTHLCSGHGDGASRQTASVAEGNGSRSWLLVEESFWCAGGSRTNVNSSKDQWISRHIQKNG